MCVLVELFMPQIEVQTGGFANESRVRASLHNAPLLQHQYLIGIDDVYETMRNKYGRATVYERFQRAHYLALANAVQTRACLVVHEYERILEHCARNCHLLLLATAQLVTTLANLRVILFRHAHYARVQVAHLRAFVDFFDGRMEVTIVNVVENCLIEQNCILIEIKHRFDYFEFVFLFFYKTQNCISYIFYLKKNFKSAVFIYRFYLFLHIIKIF